MIIDGVEEIGYGGGILYFGSVVAKRLGARVAMVIRLYPDDFPRLEELHSEGLEVIATPAEGTS